MAPPKQKIAFRNDQKLKKANVAMEYTPEQIEELRTCHSSIYHFAEKYFEIVTLDADKRTGERRRIIQTRPYQRRVLDSVINERFTIVLSPRQIGKTTLLRLVSLYYVCFERDFEIVIASNNEKTSIKTLRKIKDSYKALPMWLKPGVVKWDEKEIRFDNGCAIYASATSEDGCRGDSVNLLILDEFAHIPNRLANEFFTAIYPVVTEGKTTKMVILSTANGMSGPYYEIWAKAKRKLNQFNAVEIKWDDPPNRDENFKQKVIADLGIRRWNQEYACVDFNTNITISDPMGYNSRTLPIGEFYNLVKHINFDDNFANCKIHTPYGFESFSGVQKVVRPQYIKLFFDNNTEIGCSLNHKFSINGEFVEADKIEIGNSIDGITPLIVTDKKIINENIELYDIINSGKHHVYYTNGLISHNCLFTGSSDTLINPAILEAILWNDDFTVDNSGFARIYRKPIPGHVYVAGIDVGEGIGKDSSVIHIFDVTDTQKIEEVYVWTSNTVITQHFDEHVMTAVQYYNNAWIMLESNNLGDGTANSIWYDHEYENLVNYGKHKSLGIRSTRTSKVKSALHMKYLLETGRLIINDKDTISELSTFIDHGHQIFKAEDGQHDDLVTSMMWALFITHTEIAENVDIEPVAHNEEGNLESEGQMSDPEGRDGDDGGADDGFGLMAHDEFGGMDGGIMSNKEFDIVFR